MVTLLLDSANLDVSLSGAERAAAFQRGDIRVARSSIKRVQLTDDPWTWLRGVRKPGTHVPGVIAAGTWHSIAGTDFVMIRGRKPGVVIDLTDDAPYQRLLFTTRHALALVAALGVEDIAKTVDVVDLAAETGAISVPTKKKSSGARRPATA